MTDTIATTGLRATRPDPRTFAVPNLLTFGRIAAVPLLALALALVDGPAGRWLALTIFAAAAITDFFDGYLARAWQQQSELGRMLDPIADKLLVGVTLMMLVADHTITGWALFAAVVILAREIVVSGLREFLAELQVKLHVTWIAKWKTVIQMAALAVLLMGPAVDHAFAVFSVTHIGLGLLWMAAILTLYTGFDYLRAAVRHTQ